jgi:hypothetical protein
MRALPAPSIVVLIAGLAGLAAAGARAARASGEAGEAVKVSEGEEREAKTAAETFMRLAAHLQGSGGDPRFAERIPASPAVVEELLAGVTFASHAGKVEEPRLVRAELGPIRRVDTDVVSLDAKEYWIVRVLGAGGKTLETRADVVKVRYVLARGPSGWSVAGWDLADDDAAQESR